MTNRTQFHTDIWSINDELQGRELMYYFLN